MTERRRSHPVRGIAVRVVVLLLLGAVVNVAVAWGLVILRDAEVGVAQVIIVSDEDPYLPSDVMMVRTSTSAATYLLYAWKAPKNNIGQECPKIASLLPPWADRRELNATSMRQFQARGWPTLSMWTVIETPEESGSNAVVHGGIEVRSAQVTQGGNITPRALPLRPIWPGFAINTFLYAAILWLLFAGPFVLRRWRRIKRGLCPKCAYPVGTNEVCAECGITVKPRVARA